MRESINEVVHTLRGARDPLVILVVYLFLQSLRATLVPILAVPGVDHRHLHGDVGVRLLGEHAHSSSGWCWPSAL